MLLTYADTELERVCTDERHMKRRLDAQIAKKLMLRIAELRSATHLDDLRLGVGRWEELTGSRAGQWSARLSANWRLIVAPSQGDSVTVEVIEIVDYHRR